MQTPQAVLAALNKLDGIDKETVERYIKSLKKEIRELKGEPEAVDDEEFEVVEPTDAEPVDEEMGDEPPFPPVYESGEDYDKAGDAKQEASDLQSSGEWEKVLDKYTEAVLAAPPSALLYANRALALLKLGRPRAAERDCDLALKENPDSAKALRVRGKARKELGMWEAALKDLSASQQIDFDEGTVEDLKFLSEKRIEKEREEAEQRLKEEEKLRKRAEEIKKAQKEAKQSAREEARSAGGMPGGMGGMGGMPGGMGGMPGGMGGGAGMEGLMAGLMNDPELMAELQKPKIQKAFQDLMGQGGPMGLMSNPQKLQEIMSDPEIGPTMQKLMAKLGGGLGMSGGAMPNMGGAGGGAGHDDDDDDMGDIPDLEDLDQ